MRGLAADDLIGDVSLYTIMQQRFGIKVTSSSGMIGAAPASVEDANVLGLRRGESALVIHVIAEDGESRPIEYMTSVNHPRRVMLTTQPLADQGTRRR